MKLKFSETVPWARLYNRYALANIVSDFFEENGDKYAIKMLNRIFCIVLAVPRRTKKFGI